jgi:SAM-dependent methyltransferase
MSKHFSPACERNRHPILQHLQHYLQSDIHSSKTVLEIGSGTGQHAVFFAEHMPHLMWQSSDRLENHPSILAWRAEYAGANVLAPLELDVGCSTWPCQHYDAVFTSNTCHIMAWESVQAMLLGVAGVLQEGGLFLVYGPFNYGGEFTSASNADFDANLKVQAAHMGIRDQERMQQEAALHGLILLDDHAMPANNRLLIFKKIAA